MGGADVRSAKVGKESARKLPTEPKRLVTISSIEKKSGVVGGKRGCGGSEWWGSGMWRGFARGGSSEGYVLGLG